MNPTIQYYKVLNTLITHALLSLYCTMHINGGFWSIKKRNTLLVKFLKPKVKDKHYAKCKSEIKTMLIIGRKSTENLEKKLWILHDISQNNQKLTQADELYMMLMDLDETHQFTSLLETSDHVIEEDVIYINKDEVNLIFNDTNQQITPLKMKVKTHRLELLIGFINAKRPYRIDIERVDENELIHLLLHRITQI